MNQTDLAHKITDRPHALQLLGRLSFNQRQIERALLKLAQQVEREVAGDFQLHQRCFPRLQPPAEEG